MVIEAFSGFSKEINSTKRPSGGTSITCRLKNGTSVLNPVFLLTNYNLSHNYVIWGNRYYFIDDIVIVGNELAEYHCSTDVLATYKDVIGASSQYVLRSASAYNQYLNDSIYPTRSDCYTTDVSVDQLTCVEDSSVVLNTGSCFVIGVQNGSGSQNGGITYYAMSRQSMQNLLEYMFTDASFLDASDISVELQKELVNPFQYINSIMWFPFDLTPSSLTSASTIQFGYWTAPSTVYGYEISERSLTFSTSVTLPSHVDASSRGLYLNSAPYTRHMLYANSFGAIPIDASYFVSAHTMAILVHVDLFTGMGDIVLSDSSGHKIYKQSGQVGANAQISQVTQSVLGSALSVIGGSVGLAYGNVVGYAQGIISGIENLMPQIATTGSVGSSIDWESSLNMRVVTTCYRQASNSVSRLGRPLCEQRTINTLSGFTQVQNADVSGVGSRTEKLEVINFMEGGFYYE